MVDKPKICINRDLGDLGRGVFLVVGGGGGGGWLVRRFR
jgi:hypothetical protein